MIYIKNKKRRKEEFQFFMHDFIDSCIENGVTLKADIFPSYRWHIRAVLRVLWLKVYNIIHSLMPCLIRRDATMIVAANGGIIDDNLFPYYVGYNIVPMLWDCWPGNWDKMLHDFKLFDIKTVLVTSSQVAKRINEDTDVHAVWIPEGIKASLYDKGEKLKDRGNDVMEMGRRMDLYHDMLENMQKEGKINSLITSNINSKGALNDKHVVYSNEELYRLMSDSKIMICFPRCDTNPQTAGDIETLTQRYWEAMLSRCVIVGRAPFELIDLIGYNPVVDVDWEDAENQLSYILSHLEKYQEWVDNNYHVARKHADWGYRMPAIKKAVMEN